MMWLMLYLYADYAKNFCNDFIKLQFALDRFAAWLQKCQLDLVAFKCEHLCINLSFAAKNNFLLILTTLIWSLLSKI